MFNELEERSHQFANRVRIFCRKLKWDTVNLEDIKQLVRSSGSIGANYIEANEKLGEADLRMRIRIARKESKETIHWLRLLNIENQHLVLEQERANLINEATELKKIFSAILNKLG